MLLLILVHDVRLHERLDIVELHETKVVPEDRRWQSGLLAGEQERYNVIHRVVRIMHHLVNYRTCHHGCCLAVVLVLHDMVSIVCCVH